MTDSAVLKTLIEMSQTTEEADEYVTEFSGFSDVTQKLPFVCGMFDVTIIGRCGGNVETDYIAVLSSIINQKWR